jgi:hypothetical protein
VKKFKELFKLFLTKEKALLILFIFILINISIYFVYQKSIYSQPGYFEAYPQSGLEFFYYLHCIGLNQFHFILLMLLIPNLVSYDFLSLYQNHTSHYIEIRIGKRNYYKNVFFINIIMSFFIVLIIETLVILSIHCFYNPLQFNAFDYPEFYYRTTQILSHHELRSLCFFVILTSAGYSLVSSLLFSLQVVISNKYIFRCFGVILGIFLVLLPAIIYYLVPISNATFLLQINNLVALGMENVRENPFYLSDWSLYGFAFMIYSFISYGAFQILLKWRKKYD